MRYISHLDLMRLFMRAARRAEFPLFLTKGFSPHPKISFKRALKLGQESTQEEMTLLLNELVEIDDFRVRLQDNIPKAIEIKDVEIIPVK